jgi:hypothetical protein
MGMVLFPGSPCFSRADARALGVLASTALDFFAGPEGMRAMSAIVVLSRM